jgi:hypothetical protein
MINRSMKSLDLPVADPSGRCGALPWVPKSVFFLEDGGMSVGEAKWMSNINSIGVILPVNRPNSRRVLRCYARVTST